MLGYFAVVYLLSLAFSYELAFTQATLFIGKAISDVPASRGYQDAITPPWSTKVGIATYVACLASIVYGWIMFGWLIGLPAAIVFCVAVLFNKVLLMPKSDSAHFRKIVIHSLINRHADYLKSGDELYIAHRPARLIIITRNGH
jgi:hypothetical protein